MATISTGQSVIALGKGATWGTAVDIEATKTGSGGGGSAHALISLNTSRGEFRPNSAGFSNKIQNVEKLEESVDVTISGDLNYHGKLWLPVAQVMGTAATPAEQTTSQGDYLHVVDLADTNDGKFQTVAFLSAESDAVVEIPSVKWSSFNIDHNVNGVGTVSISGIGDRIVHQADTPQNTYTELGAMTYGTWQPCVLGGTNHYFRLNAQSGGGLSSSDDFDILGYSITMSRQIANRDWRLRGANSKYTVEPKEEGQIVGTLTVRFAESARSTLDILNAWTDATRYKAEIFFDGSQIGSGVNTSVKWQFPKMEMVGPMPQGFDVPNNNSRFRPVVTFNLLEASSAPTGMTGVTDYVRLSVINERTVVMT